MDFTPTEAAADLTGLTTDITARLATPEVVARLESENAPIDADLWREIAGAGLLGLGAPSSVDGADLTAMETTAVATALGRALARVPYPQHAVAAVPLLAEFGGDGAADLLAKAVGGDAVVTAAVEEDLGFDLLAPSTALTGGRVTGTKVNVPYGAAAHAFLVIAESDGAPVVAVVEAGPDVSVVETPSTGLTPIHEVTFADAPATVLEGGARTAARARDLLRLGVAADQSGVVAGALAATAEYARDREQFGRKIGSFQAVAQRLADGYIDGQGLALTVAQAAWLLAEGSDDAQVRAAVDTAAFWTAEAGHRVAHTTVHVHGGVGLDTSHPVHRFFLRAKQNEFTYGSAPVVLGELGAALAAR
ncbi:acyl-CoA dehydrogenase family protein [Gordonia humi]|uniref:Alkylation response protein AidB-like acyl-CoA dehydrogenase n=1 Tax=Gordonia humi TaxID=686429 RepID=A0A840ESI4_9ACTN|nr:acyl-CoA dehydrogenase family protein [Gordonia humi]MBB4134521.1 alkylation response protein AidB-like acyl-CoA dehydrogenase [Gordonia humi]